MKKITLDLDDLKVESFETTAEASDAPGTVHGYITRDLTLCDQCTDSTCGSTCGGSCSPTCTNTCAPTCAQTCSSTCDSTCSGCGGGVTCLPGCNTDFACFICTDYGC